MGREIVLESTRYVPASLCWATYAASIACIIAVFLWPQLASPYWNGLAAIVEATLVIFCFSLFCSNTSLYDPAWCVLPIGVAVGWMATGDALASPRAWYALLALLVWYGRYNLYFPWDGWVRGLETEDWRYGELAKTTGSGTAVYWLGSLVSLHLTPTLLVFFALAPAQPALSAAAGLAQLNAWDAVAVAVLFGAVAVQAIADSQLQAFRRTAYGPGTNINTASSSKAICREGLWRYSRHPNYFGEALFWCGMGAVAMAAAPARPWHATWSGGLLMLAFFRVSAYLTDVRMLTTRGPEYAAVMREVSGLVPMPPRWLMLGEGAPLF